MFIIDKLKTVKREYLILGGIGIVSILFLIFNNVNKRNYDVPDLDELKIEEITKLQVQKQSNILILEKENGKWIIQPEKYLADTSKVEEIVKLAVELKIDDLVSESKNYLLYELNDDVKVNVLAFIGDKVVRNFDMGKISPTRNHTFIKISGKDEVYAAKGNFKDNFNKQPAELRDKKVFTFAKENVKEFTVINASGRKLKLNQNMITPEIQPGTNKKAVPPLPVEKWLTSKGREYSLTDVKNLFSAVSDLDCESFIEGKTKNDYKYPIYTLVLNDGQESTISIYRKTKDDKYSAVSSKRDYPFYIEALKADKIMKKLTIADNTAK